MPYPFVNSTLQMYTRSRAEGEAIVSIANDPQSTNNPHGKKNENTEGARSPPKRSEAKRRAGEATEAARTGHNDARGATAHAQARAPKAQTPRGETERSDRTPPRGERQRDEPPNDKHPAWMWGGSGGRKGQKARAEGERGNEATDRTERRRRAGKPTARSDRAGRGAKTRTEERGREEGERTERHRGRGSGRAFCPFLLPQGG